MITCDLSQINFDAIAFPRKTKTFKNVVQLFSACHYDEAETIAKKLVGYDPQLADMRAQIAFFRSDFNACVQQALLLLVLLLITQLVLLQVLPATSAPLISTTTRT